MLNSDKELKKIKPGKVILPTLIGLGIVAWFVYRDFHKIDFSIFNFSWWAVAMILISFLLMFFRDLGYVVRLRILSSGDLSWRKCLQVVFLWEFASAITPSAIGGTSLATIFIWKEGLPVGRSTAIVIATSFLDELYFSIMFPLIILLFSKSELFVTSGSGAVMESFMVFALIGYGFKLLWTILMGYSIFINPKLFAKLLLKLFKIRFLRRWSSVVENMANDFELSNKELKSKGLGFWIKAFFATFLSWTSRYWVLNTLLLALIFTIGVQFGNGISIYEHFLIFAKQLIMWIMMLVMPTPGGSGFVETIFNTYMADFIPVAGFAVIMALVWRMVTYYPYLIIGAFITPKWVNKKFQKKTS